MTTTDENVEALLEQASPRPSPPGKDEQMIREAVFSEWQAVTGQRRTRKRVTRFAIAATVLLGVAVSFNSLQQNGIAAVQVATIAKTHGTIYVEGEDLLLHEMADMSSIMSGQSVKTDHDSGIALEWADGGSLRIAENTSIEFRSAEEIYLNFGRIYFDSTPSELLAGTASADATLRILTKHGTVTHLGTQYMTYSSDSELTVSVREGEVLIDGNFT